MTVPVLGSLTWLPAAGHPELLAQPVAQSVSAVGLDCYVAAIDPELADTAAFCAAYDVNMTASANCVVVAGRRGENTTMAACLVLAVDRADVNKTVRKHLDVRKISFAGVDDAVAQTQMEYGGITPIGLPGGWPILVDSAVAATEWAVIGSGIRGSKIAIRGQDLLRLPNTVDLALTMTAG